MSKKPALALSLVLVWSAFYLGAGTAPAGAAVAPCPDPVVVGEVDTVTCAYTGDVQTWTVPTGVTQATFDVQGAQGGEGADGSGSNTPPGIGGRAVATISVTPGEVLRIVVGGAGAGAAFSVSGGLGGFNGGGRGWDPPFAGGGGGASDVRAGGATLQHRAVVAGGGGGGARFTNGGGHGGGLAGGDGGGAVFSSGRGGNQDGTTGNGVLGTGSDGPYDSGGGGGGYYGGSGGNHALGGGGGGSGLTPDGTGMTNGFREGNGQVVITYVLPPPGASLLSPSGGGTHNPVTYSWRATRRATFYYLWINDTAKGTVYRKWYTASQAGCDGGGTCSVSNPLSLRAGSYRWWIRTWNSAGYGPWSAARDFGVPLPGRVELFDPSGTGHTNPVAYSWEPRPGATWYYLWINKDGSSQNVLKRWFTAAELGSECAEATATCSVMPSLNLPAGSYRWWVQAWSPAGFGAWSLPAVFGVD